MQTGQWKRSEIRKLLKEGKITVDNILVTSEHYFVKDPKKILVEEKKLELPKEKIYLALNKPAGYSCQKGTSPNVLDLVSEKVFAIGRLDKDTEGLLLLSNDGDYAHSILSPEKKTEKKYLALLRNSISKKEIQTLEQGVQIKLRNTYYLTKPCKITQISQNKITIILTEGKKRQIRKMIKSLGNKVLSLQRTHIGKLTLGNLPLGSYKTLSKQEALSYSKK